MMPTPSLLALPSRPMAIITRDGGWRNLMGLKSIMCGLYSSFNAS